MRSLPMKKLFLSVVASVLIATGAFAADPVITVEPAYIAPDSNFDWNGFYMGVGISGSSSTGNLLTAYADFIAGINIVQDDILFGIEGYINGYSSNSPTSGYGVGIDTRIGYLATPDALLYLSGGGYFYDTGTQTASIGAGAEFAISDNVSLDLHYRYWGWSSTAVIGHSLSASALWHF